MTPEWEDRNLIGKIVYVDRTANQLVITDANEGNSIEIRYKPGETYEPYIGSPAKWSPDGKKIAFGCWRGESTRLNLCILNIVENIQGQNNSISQGLQVIQLPEQYTPNALNDPLSNALIFASLAWIMDSNGIVLTPFCIVKVNTPKTDCLDWENLERLNELNKKILQSAKFIAPSPVNENIWALIVDDQILFMDLESGAVTEIKAEENTLFLSWSPNGEKITTLAHGVIGLIDIQTSSYKKLIWEDDNRVKIEPKLLTDNPGTGSYLLSLYSPRQNIAWSPDSRYLVLNVYLGFPLAESSKIYAGIFYFDIERGALFPARVNLEELGFPSPILLIDSNTQTISVNSSELGLFVSPDWYACDDPENVCELYK
jgi:hypothetical protein